MKRERGEGVLNAFYLPSPFPFIKIVLLFLYLTFEKNLTNFKDNTETSTASERQEITNEISEKVDVIDIYDLTTESTELYIYDSLNDEDLYGSNKDLPRKPTKKPLIIDTKPIVDTSNEVHGVDKETNTLVPTLTETLINLKHGLEKDIDNFKIPGKLRTLI